MTKKVKITDINGNSLVTNDTPFILINKKNLYKYLIKVSDDIWKYDMNKLVDLFSAYNLNSNNFSPVGYLKNSRVGWALFVNKNVSEVASDYNYVGPWGKRGSLWAPISKGKSGLSLIYSSTKDKPRGSDIRLFNHRIMPSSFLSQKERLGLLTADRRPDPEGDNDFQSYTVQGELKSLCNNSEECTVLECSDEFHPFDGTFAADYEGYQNVGNNANTNTNTQIKFRGKHVVLVESDDPFYLNRSNSTPAKYIPTTTSVTGSNDPSMLGPAKFTSPVILDLNKENLGSGYSFADHYKQLCDFTNCSMDNHDELFNNQTQPNPLWKNPICWIILLILILILLN
ncbi:MAG: hypothetical protein Harvfovirus21_8 [Harvfovirus sp.]|uniref:Uncharacterized protein n=1 Tax=Harvfovirus sp. TaxID=2487768 RepID=A0A3G5A4R6_9VIRU|nr:MAG: hypothetical protein Harvfovirus21_8 [Harvfovirus sp.]